VCGGLKVDLVVVTGSGWVAVGCWMSSTGRLFKARALRAEGQREAEEGRDGERRERERESCAGRDTAIVCLQRRLRRRFPPEHSAISHEVGE